MAAHSVADHEEYQDSLFGSPPASPRGRSPSPALALPSANISSGLATPATAQQNVGTIALPGSHLFSELPIDQIALSASLQPTQRPPANGVNTPVPCASYPCGLSSTSSVPPHRSSSAASAKKTKRKASKSKSKEPTPWLLAPEIFLPNALEHPPANFLRNQPGLLGNAGLVSGVRTSNLSVQRHTQGTTPSNPIIVEDEDDTPILGRSRHSFLQSIDPSLLPAPTNHEIVAMLIKQRDIFPILESILKLIANQVQPNPQPKGVKQCYDERRHQTKRRKLNHVPAGATDWDVPYPFAQGEGPKEYSTTWERERGKQLISQLVKLIKTAARKAATKNYLQNEMRRTAMDQLQKDRQQNLAATDHEGQDQDKDNILGHYRPATVFYGRQGSDTGQDGVIEDQDLTSSVYYGNTAPQTNFLSQPQQETPFDQLISSLLAASPVQGLPSNSVNLSLASTNDAHFVTNSSSSSSAEVSATPGGSNEGVDQTLFDSWMSVLQTFPVPLEGFSEAHSASSQNCSDPTSSQSSSQVDDFDYTYFGTNMGSFTDYGIEDTDLASLFSPSTTKDSFDANANAGTNYSMTSTNAVIDPAISTPQARPPIVADPRVFVHDVHQPPSLVPSPIPSTSSYAGPDPSTPNSAAWETSFPEIFFGMNEDQNRSQGVRGALDDQISLLYAGLDKDQSSLRRVDKGKGKKIQTSARDPLPIMPASNSKSLPPKSHGALNRENVVKKGREQTARLAEELKRVKIQLWETTIEQAALTHLANHYNGQS